MIISVCNHKGGVGKTAVTTNLANAIAKSGVKTLVVDLDPQASTTKIIDPLMDENQFTIFDLLNPDDPPNLSDANATVQPVNMEWFGECPIMIIPSERAISECENDRNIGWESRLKAVLTLLNPQYDVILIDCPPNLGMLTINALVASNYVLFVTEPRSESVIAIKELSKTVTQVQTYYNEHIVVLGVVVNKVLTHFKDQKIWLEALEQEYGKQILPTYIPNREVIAKNVSLSKPIECGSELSTVFTNLLENIKARIRSL